MAQVSCPQCKILVQQSGFPTWTIVVSICCFPGGYLFPINEREYLMSYVFLLVLFFVLTITPLHGFAQVAQTELPFDRGGPIATLSRLQEVFVKRQGHIQSDAKGVGLIMATFPNGGTVSATTFTTPTPR
jgi:hypothetical protein